MDKQQREALADRRRERAADAALLGHDFSRSKRSTTYSTEQGDQLKLIE